MVNLNSREPIIGEITTLIAFLGLHHLAMVAFLGRIPYNLLIGVREHQITLNVEATLASYALACIVSHCAGAAVLHRLVKIVVLDGVLWSPGNSLYMLFGRILHDIHRLDFFCRTVDELVDILVCSWLSIALG